MQQTFDLTTTTPKMIKEAVEKRVGQELSKEFFAPCKAFSKVYGETLDRSSIELPPPPPGPVADLTQRVREAEVLRTRLISRPFFRPL